MTFWTFYKAGKFAKDWKKSLKIVSSEKNLALQPQGLLWRLDLLGNEDSSFFKEIWGNVHDENENERLKS